MIKVATGIGRDASGEIAIEIATTDARKKLPEGVTRDKIINIELSTIAEAFTFVAAASIFYWQE